MPFCSVKWCGKRSVSSSLSKDGITFHRFPKCPEIKKKWIVATHREDNWFPGKRHVICSQHFTVDSFRPLCGKRRLLFASALPTLMLPYLGSPQDQSLPAEPLTLSRPAPAYPKMAMTTQPTTSFDALNLPITMTESPPISEINAAEDQVIVEEYKCRTCLSMFATDKRLYNIFDSWFSPFQTSTTIVQDLMRLTRVEIMKTDRHSKLICARCIGRLHNACSFILSVQENEKLLNERSDDLANGSVWPKPIQLEKNISEYIRNGDLDCEIKREIESDEETETVNGEDGYQMEIKIEPEEFMENQPDILVNGVFSLQDGSDFITKGDSQHLDVTVKEEPLSEDELEPNEDLPEECILCAKKFNCITGLKAHVIANHSYKSVRRKTTNQPSPKKHENEHVCATCKRRFSTPTDLMVHETCHNKVICYGCNEKFDDFSTLLNHRRICPFSPKDVPKPTKLEDVVRKTISISAADKNEENNQDYNMISCSACSMVFPNIIFLNVHKGLHHTSDNDDEISN